MNTLPLGGQVKPRFSPRISSCPVGICGACVSGTVRTTVCLSVRDVSSLGFLPLLVTVVAPEAVLWVPGSEGRWREGGLPLSHLQRLPCTSPGSLPFSPLQPGSARTRLPSLPPECRLFPPSVYLFSDFIPGGNYQKEFVRKYPAFHFLEKHFCFALRMCELIPDTNIVF